MSEHDRMRELLALSAADALDSAEERELAEHLKSCAECAAEMELLRELSASLYRLPMLQSPRNWWSECDTRWWRVDSRRWSGGKRSTQWHGSHFSRGRLFWKLAGFETAEQ